VHATIAGVLIAFTVPARNRIDAPTFLQRARDLLSVFERSGQEPSPMLTDQVQQESVIALEELCEQVQAPLQKLEHALQWWVALVIMPIFALANTGIVLTGRAMSNLLTPNSLGIFAGLLIGKPLGIVLSSLLAIRMRVARLSEDLSWTHLIGAGFLGGIGFTMSIFITLLAFQDSQTIQNTKISILVSSLFAGTLGFLILSRQRSIG